MFKDKTAYITHIGDGIYCRSQTQIRKAEDLPKMPALFSSVEESEIKGERRVALDNGEYGLNTLELIFRGDERYYIVDDPNITSFTTALKSREGELAGKKVGVIRRNTGGIVGILVPNK